MIKDDPALSWAEKNRFSQQFIAVVEGHASALQFSQAVTPCLGDTLLAEEKQLIAGCPAVLRITRACSATEQAAIARCVRIMSEGMAAFQRTVSIAGLADMAALDRYCYVVAGVVGEMLTDLFAQYDAQIAANRDTLQTLAVSFGQGLQLTNILKDFWEDRLRGACWLPQSHFAAYGVDLTQEDWNQAAFADALGELIGLARRHLEQALQYLHCIPKHQTGIRRFCAWAIGMALLTLRKIYQHRDYRHGQRVKITRYQVYTTLWICNRCLPSNRALGLLFHWWSRSLPTDGCR